VCRGGLRCPAGRHRPARGAASQATLNAATGEPVSKKRIYDVLGKDCYDKDPSRPWHHEARLQRNAIPEDVKEKRVAWATFLLALKHRAAWYHANVIWVDICNSIVPRSKKKTAEQALARKGRKGWVSKDAKGCDRWLLRLTERRA